MASERCARYLQIERCNWKCIAYLARKLSWRTGILVRKSSWRKSILARKLSWRTSIWACWKGMFPSSEMLMRIVSNKWSKKLPTASKTPGQKMSGSTEAQWQTYVDSQLDLNRAILRYFQLIQQYLYGKIKRWSTKSAFELKKWSYLDILTVKHRKKIHKLALKLSKSLAGSPAYLASYKTARSQVESNLSDKRRQKYKALAKEWSEKNLPPKMQQRYVRSNDSNRS